MRVENETVWLNRQQIAALFSRDVKTIGKHISNALHEELEGESVVAKFATTASDGKNYQVEYYNLDVIISVGYRVKSKRDTISAVGKKLFAYIKMRETSSTDILNWIR